MNLDMMISEFSQQLALIRVRACSRFLELFQQEEPSSIGYLGSGKTLLARAITNEIEALIKGTKTM